MVLIDAPALVDLGHGTVRYRKDEDPTQEARDGWPGRQGQQEGILLPRQGWPTTAKVCYSPGPLDFAQPTVTHGHMQEFIFMGGGGGGGPFIEQYRIPPPPPPPPPDE